MSMEPYEKKIETLNRIDAERAVEETLARSEELQRRVCGLLNKPAPTGLKYDGGKPRMDLISPAALLLLGKVLDYGAKKYNEHNWKTLDQLPARHYAAILRHLCAWQRGEVIDQESGLPHLGHALACLTFLIAHEEGDTQPWATQK